jgi:hypothetical protein
MNRTLANVVVDLLAAMLFVGMIATGYVLRFPLPPGTNRTLTLWGLTRHQWGGIHYWISLILLGVIAAHLVLHWKWIATVVGKRLRLTAKHQPSMVRSGMIVTGVFGVVFALFAFVVHWSVREMVEPLHDLDSLNHDEVVRRDTQTSESRANVDFWVDVYPILASRCVSCHGAGRQFGEFRADQREAFFGQQDEQPVIVPGSSATSPLIAIVSGDKSDMPMADKHRLADHEVSVLRAWIDAGAAWPDIEK